jgi:hypothetical protein
VIWSGVTLRTAPPAGPALTHSPRRPGPGLGEPARSDDHPLGSRHGPAAAAAERAARPHHRPDLLAGRPLAALDRITRRRGPAVGRGRPAGRPTDREPLTGERVGRLLARGPDARHGRARCRYPAEGPDRPVRKRTGSVVGVGRDPGGRAGFAPRKGRTRESIRQSRGPSRKAECAYPRRRTWACHTIMCTPQSQAGRRDQTWNELPQPQLLTTLGLLNTNPRFSRPS